ncbi:MAG TPA: trypsin-like peptidase domain-containing protein [Candidatus Faecousia faecavium]|nr:trypsin-like peptidase domain-containing protein [Candidatus Faecousia faecavium]
MEQRYNYTDWDDSVYGTGRTEPPKHRSGLLAMMLILIIFLCGIITVLGILNVRLFQQLQNQDPAELAISFRDVETQPQETAAVETQPKISSSRQADTINLQSSPASVENVPTEGGLSLQEIYERNIKSVVSINAILTGGSSTGTGVILTEDGYIVTNAHVVENAAAISVQLTDQDIFQAQVIGTDELSDLAVLKISASGLTPAQFGDSSSLRVGDTVVAIGDPLGVEFRGTYTDGIISGIDRDVDMDGRTMTLLQTNAALNSGNSGGPLINCYGQVIGINTMKIGAFTDKAGVEGLGFAIPSTTVKTIVDQLISQGYVSGRPTLGISGEGLSSFYQHYYRMPAGLYITQVSQSSEAYEKGVEEGDLLLSINDTPVTSMDDLKSTIFSCEVGQTVQVTIYRGGQQYLLELTLEEDRG